MKLKNLLLGLLSLFLMAACNTSTPPSDENQVVEERVILAPDWTKNANIYEVNLRQYSEEGSLTAFAKELPRLKKMGVDILWFMPIHPIGELNKKGSLGSYYAVKDYKAVNPEFGTFEDFKMVVDQAHKLGMYVMLDWVANHTAWDNVWVDPHPAFYEKDSLGEFISPFDWTDVIALDYSNQEMRAKMIDALKFWIAEANIDGYRCDVASEVPTEFWEEVRPQLQAIKPVFMLAESEQADLLEKAFDMNYGWEFHHIKNGVAKGEKNVQDIKTYWEKEKKMKPERALMMYFITNHDENSWNGTIKERLDKAENAMAVLSWTLGGMPLIYSGQEAANEKRLEFFEKDAISWNDYPKADFYGSLNTLKHENPAIWNGAHGGDVEMLTTNEDNKVFAFKRQKDNQEILVILNLSKEDVNLEIDLSAYKDLMAEGLELNDGKLKMSPWAYGVYEK
jgi:glycosidase